MAKVVKVVPEGYHTVTPYLAIRDATRAIAFYTRAFEAQEITRMAGPDGKVMHAELRIGDSMLMLSEDSPESGCHSPLSLKGTTFTLYLYVPDVDTTFARAIAAGATAVMPVANMFWGDRHGQVVDPFGHRWSIATHTEDLSQQEITQRAQQFFAEHAKA